MGHSGVIAGKSYDVVVLGGGIVGAACVYELVRSGLSTALVEPTVIGGGATAAGMGHLAVMDDSEAQFALTRYSQLLWQELSDQLPASAEYRANGAIWVAADDEEMDEVDRKHHYYSQRDVPVVKLDARELAESEPNLRPGLAGGLLLVEDAVVYPPCLAQFLVEQAIASGMDLFAGRGADEVTDSGVLLGNGDTISAGCTVVATGAMAGKMFPFLKVHPRKGHLVITDRYPGFLRHQLVELGYLKSAHAIDGDSVAFNVQPRITGQVLIGSSRQYGSNDPAVEHHMLQAMLQRAIEYMPGLAGLSAVRTWTGFRAATPDKLPLIGICPGYNNVYLATGHEGLGISTSLATGKILVDIILGRDSAIPRDPYAPERACALHA